MLRLLRRPDRKTFPSVEIRMWLALTLLQGGEDSVTRGPDATNLQSPNIRPGQLSPISHAYKCLSYIHKGIYEYFQTYLKTK